MKGVSTTHPAQGRAAVDSPGARTRAHARVTPAPEPVKGRPLAVVPDHAPAADAPSRPQPKRRPERAPRRPRVPLGLLARRGLSRWWAWSSRPTSLRAAWRLSAVNKTRIPLGSTPVGWLWRLSNITDRLVMFALVMIAPTVLTGPLRWLAARPTRRWAFYLIVAGFVATHLTLPGMPPG